MKYAIIAAGNGSRLAKEGVTAPKPLVKVNGEQLINRLIRVFCSNNATEIVVICNGHTQLEFSSSPSLNYEKGKWRATMRQGFNLKYLTQQRKWYFQTSPSLYVNYKKSTRTETNASFGYNQSIQGLSDFALDSYQTNYRTWQTSPTFMPRTNSLNFSFTHNYKRVVKEFFSNFSLSANRMWSNSVMDMQIQNGNYLMTYVQHNTKSTNLNGRFWFSKGFYKHHFKTSCGITATYSDGEQYTGGKVLGYEYRSLTLSPSLTYSPSWAYISYNDVFVSSYIRTACSWLSAL